MLKNSHIKVADNALKNIQLNIRWKINRKAYLIGSVLPDINCIYPTHTVRGTFRRFRNRLVRMDKLESNIVKSFTLGVITHYICDYFCYAHNLAHPDPKHALYERYMKKHIKLHNIALTNMSEQIDEQCNEIQLHIIESMKHKDTIEELIELISIKGNDHIEYIMELVSKMHNTYLYETNNTESIKWYNSIDKIELDLEYATFMCQKIALLILNPKAELVCNV